jgi:hypothetical protein
MSRLTLGSFAVAGALLLAACTGPLAELDGALAEFE